MKTTVPLIIEIIGIIVVSIGITYEITAGGAVGLLVITTGSAIIATGSLIWAKIYKQIRK